MTAEERARSLREGLQIGSYTEIETKSREKHAGILISKDQYYLKLETTSAFIFIDTNEIVSSRQQKFNNIPAPSTNGAISSGHSDSEAQHISPSSPELPSPQEEQQHITLERSQQQTQSEEVHKEKERQIKLALSEKEIQKELEKIESRFSDGISAANLSIITPDFVLPQQDLQGKTTAEKNWLLNQFNKAKNIYDYASAIGETTPRFSRIASIIGNLQNLTKELPESANLQRCVAYCFFLVEDYQQALSWYTRAARTTEEQVDLHNIAVLHLQLENFTLALIELERLFHGVSITENLNDWYIFIHLQLTQKRYTSLSKLWDHPIRAFSQEERLVLLETLIYLLKITGDDQAAQDILHQSFEEQLDHQLILSAFQQLIRYDASSVQEQQPSREEKLKSEKDEPTAPHADALSSSQQAQLFKKAQQYHAMRDYRNVIHTLKSMDPDYPGVQTLLEQALSTRKHQSGRHSQTHPKEPTQNNDLKPADVDQLFTQAQRFLNQGDPSNAINRIRRVLEIDREYHGAQAFLERCLRMRRLQSQGRHDAAPSRETDYYVQAQRAASDAEAIKYLYLAIEHGQRVPNAVKSLANRLVKLDRDHEAIDVLNKYRPAIRDQQSIDNVLIDIYTKLKQHEKVLPLLENRLASPAPTKSNAETLRRIADCHINLGNYTQAKQYLQEAIKLTTDNRVIRKRLAWCYIKEMQYQDAEYILRDILLVSPDDEKARELLHAIQDAKDTGRFDETISAPTAPDIRSDIGSFATFFLDRCEFRGVPTARQQEKRLDITDIRRLEKLADGASYAGNYHDRAEFYLSAANIVCMNDAQRDYTTLCSFLLRSFVSRGNASIGSKSLDTIRDWYGEALSFYDNTPKNNVRDENTKDAFNAIVCFLYTTLERREIIPLRYGANDDNFFSIFSIENALEDVWGQTQQAFSFFDSVAYLTSRSQWTRELLLPLFLQHHEMRPLVFSYLFRKLEYSPIKAQDQNFSILEEFWGQLDKQNQVESNRIYSDLNLIAHFEFKSTWLEETLQRIEALKKQLFLQLDQYRVGERLYDILDLALRFCKEVSFEEREYLCKLIDEDCRNLLDMITKEPTRLSIERLYDILKTIQSKTDDELKYVYESSAPRVTLTQLLPSYIPNDRHKISVQITIKNGENCSPIESVELEILKTAEEIFEVEQRRFPLERGSLRGGQKEIMLIPIRVNDKIMQAESFSLPVCVHYRDRSGEAKQTASEIFSIRLFSEDTFEQIENPYSMYVESGPVEDKEMFYGRDELIDHIAKILCEGHAAKSIILYGQKRVGKSSIRYHLKQRLEGQSNLLVLDIDNIAALINLSSNEPFFHQILWQIIDELERAIKQREKQGDLLQNLALPDANSFYQHSDPLFYFQKIFRSFREAVEENTNWKGIRVVLLFDEFQYIYDLIHQDDRMQFFMKSWKALLQRGFFSTVLVGQDVMTRFINKFANEFGSIEKIRVSYLRTEHAKALIEKPVLLIEGTEVKTRYLEGAVDHILYLTAGNPYYIQIVCYHLIEHLNHIHAQFITKADVDQVKNELIRGKDALSVAHFDNLISSGDPAQDDAYKANIIKIMAAIARKNRTGPCSKEDIADASVDISTILEDLADRDVLQREPGQCYTIRVGLFKEWLLARY
jgi:tetratricopeptide (TPR) repeat protein